ncbi:hypothetical protein OHB12_07130 [Nocardia sp. NBC_01730]|uniref:hypothetical protein n=1 Tax=Nocardia sp. NBC_01730 TaxID=2975998 RepID=UPI002E14E1ED|nr:hypothetical protein OHB12_07130 [Nocardia sp. NBC_01730]
MKLSSISSTRPISAASDNVATCIAAAHSEAIQRVARRAWYAVFESGGLAGLLRRRRQSTQRAVSFGTVKSVYGATS